MKRSFNEDNKPDGGEIPCEPNLESLLLSTRTLIDWVDTDHLDVCAKSATGAIIKNCKGPLIPTIMAVDGVGFVEICDLCVTTEYMPKLMQMVLKMTDAQMYALSLQTWGTEFVDSAREYGYEIQNMPADDRQEFANIFIVDRAEGFVRHSVSTIEQLGNGERRLKDWINVSIEGSPMPFLVTGW